MRTVLRATKSDVINPLIDESGISACAQVAGRIEAAWEGIVVNGAAATLKPGKQARPDIGSKLELLRLLSDVMAGRIDMVVCEALDRIARDGEDISWIGKKLWFDRVRLVTATEGEIDEVKLAVAGLLGSMFLSNLQRKTLRGMKGAVLAGRIAGGGGKAYGCRRVAKQDDMGAVIRGVFEVDVEQAEIVRRICSEFAAGRSPIDIATELNTEHIASPRAGEWNASTSRGDPKKVVGILHNPLYRGQLVWGRRMASGPRFGQARAALSPP